MLARVSRVLSVFKAATINYAMYLVPLIRSRPWQNEHGRRARNAVLNSIEANWEMALIYRYILQALKPVSLLSKIHRHCTRRRDRDCKVCMPRNNY